MIVGVIVVVIVGVIVDVIVGVMVDVGVESGTFLVVGVYVRGRGQELLGRLFVDGLDAGPDADANEADDEKADGTGHNNEDDGECAAAAAAVDAATASRASAVVAAAFGLRYSAAESERGPERHQLHQLTRSHMHPLASDQTVTSLSFSFLPFPFLPLAVPRYRALWYIPLRRLQYTYLLVHVLCLSPCRKCPESATLGELLTRQISYRIIANSNDNL